MVGSEEFYFRVISATDKLKTLGVISQVFKVERLNLSCKKKDKQLNVEKRYQIEPLQHAGFNQTKIAAQLRVHSSTSFRQLKRSIPTRGKGTVA